MSDIAEMSFLSNLRKVIVDLAVGGFAPAAFNPSYPSNAICHICQRVCNSVVFVESCGHRYCRNCLLLSFFIQSSEHGAAASDSLRSQIIAQEHENFKPDAEMAINCVAVNCPVTLKWDDVIPDKAMERQLSRLTCHCVNGICDFEGKFNEYSKHVGECQFVTVTCEYCQSNFVRPDYSMHLAVCDGRPEMRVSCEHCDVSISKRHLVKHIAFECSGMPVACPYCASEFPRNSIEDHANSCVLTDGRCPFGCSVEPGTPSKQHYKQWEAIHYGIVSEMLEKMREADFSSALQLLKQLNPTQLSSAFLNLVNDLDDHRSKLKLDHLQLDEMQLDPMRLIKMFDESELNLGSVKSRLESMKRQELVLKNGANDACRLVGETDQLANDNKRLLEELSLVVQRQSTKFVNDLATIKILERRSAHLNDLSRDGILYWRIDNVSTRFEAGRDIYSPSFYDSPSGHKMRLKLSVARSSRSSVNGDFWVVSLYVVICRGEYDAICKWPFTRGVELTCFDQRISGQTVNGAGVLPKFKHHVMCIRPNVVTADKMAALRRPQSDYNPAFGVKFLEMSVESLNTSLGNRPFYVRDNVMYIRATVEPYELIVD